MENENVLDSGISMSDNLVLTGPAKDYLRQTGGWAKFLAILGFIYCGFIILAAFFVGSIFSKIPASSFAGAGAMPSAIGGIATVVYLVIGLIFLYPNVRMFQFAVKAKAAIDYNDSAEMELSMKRLRSNFRFWGIFFIIILSLYALIVIGVLMSR